MKHLRRLLAILLYACLGLVLLVGLAFFPPLQTALAKRQLRQHHDLRVALDSFSAGWRSVTIRDLRLSRDRIAFKLPSLSAQLPLLESLRHREVHLTHLVAKGWTLDLSRRALPEFPGGNPARPDRPLPEAYSAQLALGAIATALSEQDLPFPVSIGSAVLEGRVVLPGGAGRDPLWLDLQITAKDLASGSDGTLEITASRIEESRSRTDAQLDLRGVATIQRRTPAHVQLAHFTLDGSAVDPRAADNRPLLLRLAVRRADTGADVSLALDRGGRRVFDLQLHPRTGADAAHGQWTADLESSDIAILFRSARLPKLTLRGHGDAALATDLTQTTLAGTLDLTAEQLVVPGLEHLDLGAVRTQLRFAVRRDQAALHIDRLDAAVHGTDIELSATATQPFAVTFGGDQFSLSASDPSSDCLQIDLQKLPLSRLVPLPAGLDCEVTSITGSLGLRAAASGLEVRSTGPLVIAGVTVRHGPETLARDLVLSFPLSGRLGASGWNLETPSLRIHSLGRSVAELSLAATNDGSGKPVTVNGRYTAAETASGDFTATIDRTGTVVDAHANLPLAAPGSTLTASPHLELRSDRTFGLTLPLAITSGPKTTDLECTLESRSRDRGKAFLYLNLTGKEAHTEHLVQLGDHIRQFLPWVVGAEPSADAPLWRNLEATAQARIDRLHHADRVLTHAFARLSVGPRDVRLDEAQVILPTGKPATCTGAITFDPGAAEPYVLTGLLSVDIVNAAHFFPAPDRESEPRFEGIFSFQDTLSSRAATVTELQQHLRGEVRLSAEAGMLRLLKTNISDGYTEGAKPVSDALAKTGSAVAWLAGAKGRPSASRDKSVGAKASAVQDLNYELGAFYFEKASIEATHEADGSIRLGSIGFDGPLGLLTGSGTLGAGDFASFLERPLQCTLRLDAAGRLADLVTAADLAGNAAAGNNRIRLSTAIEVGGTLAAVDTTRWHDALVAKFRENRAKR